MKALNEEKLQTFLKKFSQLIWIENRPKEQILKGAGGRKKRQLLNMIQKKKKG